MKVCVQSKLRKVTFGDFRVCIIQARHDKYCSRSGVTPSVSPANVRLTGVQVNSTAVSVMRICIDGIGSGTLEDVQCDEVGIRRCTFLRQPGANHIDERGTNPFNSLRPYFLRGNGVGELKFVGDKIFSRQRIRGWCLRRAEILHLASRRVSPCHEEFPPPEVEASRSPMLDRAGIVKVSCTPSPAWCAARSLIVVATSGERATGSPGAPHPATARNATLHRNECDCENSRLLAM